MPCAAPLARDAIRARVQAAMDRKRLTVAQVAQRTGLCRRTIQRFVDGETFSPETLEAIEVALRIRVAGEPDSPAPNRTNVPQAERPGRREGPVVGWDQAAQVLGMHRNTLARRRAEHGDRTSTPWWKSADATTEWFERLLRGGE